MKLFSECHNIPDSYIGFIKNNMFSVCYALGKREAIQYGEEAVEKGCFVAYYTFGKLYDSGFSDGFSSLKNDDKACSYYEKYILSDESEYCASDINNISVMYSRKGKYLYALLLASLSNNEANYKFYAEKIQGIFKNEVGAIPIINDAIKTIDNYGQVKAIYDETVLKLKENSEIIRCPRGGSPQITTSARGVNHFGGGIGASQTVNRCAKCGNTWKTRG